MAKTKETEDNAEVKGTVSSATGTATGGDTTNQPATPAVGLYSEAIPVDTTAKLVLEPDGGRNTLTRAGHAYQKRVLGILRALGRR